VVYSVDHDVVGENGGVHQVIIVEIVFGTSMHNPEFLNSIFLPN